jgi:hypothetical protein
MNQSTKIRAAYTGLEGTRASLKAQVEVVEGARDAAVAQYSADLYAGDLRWIMRNLTSSDHLLSNATVPLIPQNPNSNTPDFPQIQTLSQPHRNGGRLAGRRRPPQRRTFRDAAVPRHRRRYSHRRAAVAEGRLGQASRRGLLSCCCALICDCFAENSNIFKTLLTTKQPQLARINGFQRMFKVAESSCDDLAATADNVALKLSLWNGRQGAVSFFGGMPCLASC